MIPGLERVKSHRIWFVPELEVWGLADWGTVDYLVVEQIGATDTLGYGSNSLGGEAQEVAFAELEDHRGNSLPDTIDAPRVIVRPRSAEMAYVVGSESESSFKLARDPNAAGPVTADLIVIEMGS